MKPQPLYYQPQIEEFHRGFQFERQMEDGGWIKCIDDGAHLSWDFEDDIKAGRIRVKCLDAEDIRECGWENGMRFGAAQQFHIRIADTGRYWTLEYNQEDRHSLIFKGWPGDVRLKGTILNISELRKMMKRLAVQTTAEIAKAS